MTSSTLPPTPPKVTEMASVTVVENVTQLAQLFEKWRAIRVNGLQKIAQAGEGTTIQSEVGPLVLSEDSLLAFRSGIQMCLELFEDNPLLILENPHNQGPYAH